jgi:hypothetical protein
MRQACPTASSPPISCGTPPTGPTSRSSATGRWPPIRPYRTPCRSCCRCWRRPTTGCGGKRPTCWPGSRPLPRPACRACAAGCPLRRSGTPWSRWSWRWACSPAPLGRPATPSGCRSCWADPIPSCAGRRRPRWHACSPSIRPNPPSRSCSGGLPRSSAPDAFPPPDDMPFGEYTLQTLVRPGPAARRRVAEALLAKLHGASGWEAERLLWNLMVVAFKGDPLAPRPPSASLDRSSGASWVRSSGCRGSGRRHRASASPPITHSGPTGCPARTRDYESTPTTRDLRGTASSDHPERE